MNARPWTVIPWMIVTSGFLSNCKSRNLLIEREFRDFRVHFAELIIVCGDFNNDIFINRFRGVCIKAVLSAGFMPAHKTSPN